MPRKIILDLDPGIDDALSLCMALFEPELEVMGVTVCGSHVPPQMAVRNVQAVIAFLDPPLLPRLGVGHEMEKGIPNEGRNFYGFNVLGGTYLPVAELRGVHPAEKIISDLVHAYPHEITVLSFGPLTNIAQALVRDPELATLIGRMIIMGGTVSCPGNVTPAAEFNIFCDPDSARKVFRAGMTKTLIPLDITSRVVLDYDILQHIPPETTPVGDFLHRILPQGFLSYREHLGVEGLVMQDAIGLISLTHPNLFKTKKMAGDVEVYGEITRGATIFDRRHQSEWSVNMEVVTEVNVPAVMEQITQALSRDRYE